jgi:hypothetical protein
MKYIVNFSNNITLIYDLVEHDICKAWASLISDEKINDCCKINHYVGYADESLINERINRLYELADLINYRVPDRVIKKEITKNTWQEAFHVMHVHFPDLKNDNLYSDIWNELSEYNDIIHWLESTLINVWGKTSFTSESSLFRIPLDFNKSSKSSLPISLDAYRLCEPATNFGDLSLHYTHVGKHAYELFIVNDLSCPKEQFVPQTTFNASCRMLFTDYFYDTPLKRQLLHHRWKKFYDVRGGLDFWNYDINDSKIQFGYIKIGNLSKILFNSAEYPIPKNIIELVQFRKRLADSTVLNWHIE